MNTFTFTMISLLGLAIVNEYLSQEITLVEYKQLDKLVASSSCPTAENLYREILRDEGKIDTENKEKIENGIKKCEKKTITNPSAIS